LDDYELIADVIMNRKESDHPSYRGKSIDQLLRSPKEFTTWSKKQKDARAMAQKGMSAVLNKKTDKLTGIAKQKYDLTVKALENVVGNQSRRGVSKRSDRYNNPKAGPSTHHDPVARERGSVTAGMHRATGPEFDPNAGPPSYSRHGEFGTPREAIPPEARAPYSPANLDFGPDFTSPPSQARGPVETPYEFSNINPNAEVAPGSFAGYGPNAFGAVDQAPVDYGTTYPELSAGLYSNEVAPPDVPAVPDVMSQFDPTNFMTEEQAIEHAGFAGQRPSENVEIRNRPYGETISEQIARNAATAAFNDHIAAIASQNLAPVGAGPVNTASFTSNPYASPADLPAGPRPTADVDYGIWGGTSKFNDTYNAASSRPSFQDYENRAPLAGLGLGATESVGPVGMGTLTGVELQRDVSGISSGMYPDPARGIDTATVLDAIRNAPVTPSPMTIENFNAIFGDMPDDSTGSTRGGRASPAPAVNAPQVGGPYSFSSLESLRPAPDAAVIPGDVTGYGPGGAFSSRAPSPAFDFADIVNNTAWSGAAPASAPAATAQPAQAELPADYGRTYPEISAGLYEGAPITSNTSPFSPSPLGIGQGIIDQGPYSSPIGGLSTSFSPANLGNPMPNSAVSTQAPAAVAAPQREIVGYETITKDVPNPAWSEWSKDYATRNASQEAWLAADEDKFGWDRAPPNPSALANTSWAFKEEPARTIPVEQQGKPIYSNPVVQAQPAVNVPAIQAQPRVAAAPAASIPAVNARPAQAPLTAAPVGVGGWWDSFTNGLGNILGGMSLAGLGDYSGYGNFGGGYDASGGYGGYGGYGGTAPGDAGYGSDARSGASNMGAGNLYQ
jgi:hypothetical protein